MKRIFLTLVSVIASYCSYAQSNTFPSSGNVGIGTTSPGVNLDVFNTLTGPHTSNRPILRLVDAYNSGSNGQYFQIIGAGDGTSYTNMNLISNYGYLSFGARTDANATVTNFLNILTNGNVGIGTTSPGYKLDVEGGSAYINLDNLAALGGQLTISNGYGNEFGAVRLNLNNGGAVSWIKGLVTGPNTNTGSAMVFGVPSNTSDGTEAMRITSNGSLAIGTTDPLSYKLAVNGSAIATSMTVKLNANWPDYVFKPEYHLPSLTEVKSYIDQNHHLPDMPSEQEVIKNGINLGEMNKLLTKKVEELTLYLIEKDKAEKEANEKIQDLQSQLNTLSRRLDKLANQ